MRIKEIADTRLHYSYRRVDVMLKREGLQANVKRVYRLYQVQRLSLRMKRPKRNNSARLWQPKQVVTAMNQIWSMQQDRSKGGDRRLAAPLQNGAAALQL